jgi:predicted ArsR family transcriptional regulator
MPTARRPIDARVHENLMKRSKSAIEIAVELGVGEEAVYAALVRLEAADQAELLTYYREFIPAIGQPARIWGAL